MRKRLLIVIAAFVLLGCLLSLSFVNNHGTDNQQIEDMEPIGTVQPDIGQADIEKVDIQVQKDISSTDDSEKASSDRTEPEEKNHFDYAEVEDYAGYAVQIINDNVPYFDEEDKKCRESFENYSDLDDLGRCGEAYACVGVDIMPTEERGSIGMIKPSGWHTVKYDFVDGKYLFNRCHLIGYQIAGENALETNLITGTRYLNVIGMLPYENLVVDYVKNSNNHVLYRVTPYFHGENLVASGVLMEAWSLEDDGTGLCFCVFAYNVQPGVVIDYLTGESALDEDAALNPDADDTEPLDRSVEEIEESVSENKETDATYIGNKNSHRFHYPDCQGVRDMKESNKVFFYGDRTEAIEAGYVPCGTCKP